MAQKDFEQLRHTVRAFIGKGGEYFVAQCFEIAAVTQGKTPCETVANVRGAVLLDLEGEDPLELGLTPGPTLLITEDQLRPFFYE